MDDLSDYHWVDEDTMDELRTERQAGADGYVCCCCGDDATTLREGRPVCDGCRSMIDGGWTIAELRDENGIEED